MTIWTGPMLLRLHQYCTQDPQPPFKQIVHWLNTEFGTQLTKNACIGKAHRILHGQQPYLLLEPPAMPIRVDAPIETVVPPPLVGEIGLDINQLRRDNCRWPLGGTLQRPPYRYCGAPALLDAPYCAHHSVRAYANPRQRWE